MAGWIFQGNPERFTAIDEYLRTRHQILWEIPKEPHRKEIACGDVVFIWRSGERPGVRGIVAKAIVTGNPRECADDAPEGWHPNDTHRAKKAWRVPLQLIEARLGDNMIPSTWLKDHPDFEDLRIMRQPQGTNFKLAERHFDLLQILWDQSVLVDESDNEGFPEGRGMYVLHLLRERNSRLVKEAKEWWAKNQGSRSLFCEACNFSFSKIYGEDYIEMHHERPLSEGERHTKITDLKPVCANCHRILHRRGCSVEELKNSLETQKQ